MRVFVVVAVALLAVGCSNPKDIVLGPKPLEQLAEQGDKFKALPKEDRELLAGYLTASEISRAFGKDAPSPVTGRTVGEVLEDARAWRKKMDEQAALEKKREQEAAALKAKVEAEKRAIAEKISASVVVAVVDKRVLPKNYDVGRYSGLLVLTYGIENKTDRVITQIKGDIHFKDSTGDEIGWLPLDIARKIGAGETVRTDLDRGWKLNEFSNSDIERIAARDFGLMTVSFVPSAIAFADGEVIRAPE